MIDVTAVDFGAPAAERDITQGLEDYFVESAGFERVASGAKKVVLGNRGTGKSAIFKVLAQRERATGSVVIELAPEDYSYEMLAAALASEAEGSWAKHGAYAAAWKHLIYVLVMMDVHKRGAGRRKGDAATVHKFLRDRYPGQEINRLDALVGYLKRMEGIKIGPAEPVKPDETRRAWN